MTAQTGFGGGVYERGRRLSADQVRSATFGRTPRGRRGLIEEEVSGFLHRVAEEIGGLENHLAAARSENARLKAALREWQTQRGGPVTQRGDPVTRSGGGEVPVDVVNLISRAQRQIEAQVAETERYCRLREEEARQRYDEIVHEARRHADEEAERVVRDYRASAGPDYSSEGERAERTTVWLNALLRSLDALAAHVDATRHAFTVEVEKATHKPMHVDSGGQPHGVGPGRT